MSEYKNIRWAWVVVPTAKTPHPSPLPRWRGRGSSVDCQQPVEEREG
jgi:hypothetical protein